ncbi:proton-coupled amino acid transporter-like protein CG1139 [Diaphorina citri]|uniref:Proton-coupled amino acid transporter-like protein CG1139 n=1 Tax=Diaphorina citri TaxID=121845 RepID=A0A3Q0J6D6_DIACI|nr:proton-coupled amino acid transporter-like protein CG1139 [Diaphorina citri]
MQIAVTNGPDCLKWLSRPSPYLVDFFVSAYQLGICCAYIGFIAGTARQIADFHWNLDWDIRIWMLIVGLIICPLNQIRNLHYLSPLSAIGDFLLMGGMAIIYYFIFQHGVPSFEGVVLSEYLAAYLFTGFWGYIKWGDATQATITWNLPTSNALTESIKIIFAFLILFSYPLQCFVPIEILWQNYIKPHLGKSTPQHQCFVPIEILWQNYIKPHLGKSTPQQEKLYSTLLRTVVLWGTGANTLCRNSLDWFCCNAFLRIDNCLPQHPVACLGQNQFQVFVLDDLDRGSFVANQSGADLKETGKDLKIHKQGCHSPTATALAGKLEFPPHTFWRCGGLTDLDLSEIDS